MNISGKVKLNIGKSGVSHKLIDINIYIYEKCKHSTYKQAPIMLSN